MGALIDGDDGLPAEDVGPWAKEKHDLLCRYVDVCRSVRRKYIAPAGRGGAAYIELFCGTGRGRVRTTGEWIDGSAVAAWKKSVASDTPFSKIVIADFDPVRVDACRRRLEAAGATNVTAFVGDAKDTALRAAQWACGLGLNLAFLDPYNLASLDFSAIRHLTVLGRIDILVHVSLMDLRRNLDTHLMDEESAFDSFAPGWRDAIEHTSMVQTRAAVFEYWRGLVAGTGAYTSKDVRLISGTRGQQLYWLLLAAKHDLAHTFWKSIQPKEQAKFDF